MKNKHLIINFPDNFDNNKKGDFFEQFIKSILEPMRYKVTSRLRFTGMEIDLLAEGLDQPKKILVECKAHKDNLSADVITKLLGNIQIRNADEGWLFSTCDLSKDGRGLWKDIEENVDLAKKFTWYSPEKIIEVLISQKYIVDPTIFSTQIKNFHNGDTTLIISPQGKFWLIEILENSIPKKCVIFNAVNGNILDKDEANIVRNSDPNFSILELIDLKPNTESQNNITIDSRATIARVISGDSWDDLRPAKPTEFVGRDEIIQELLVFINNAKKLHTNTRNFAILGPSGWGKSSLVLKITDLAGGRKLKNCSITAIDTRSATSPSFVIESIKTAFLDAKTNSILPPIFNTTIESTNYPFESDSIKECLQFLEQTKKIIVLIFDQFEELFYKEDLFEIFDKVKSISLMVDSKQIPFLLGFAWKTDITLPQEHPAYHLWHQLQDRRKTFIIREFGRKDILKLILKAEKETRLKINPALKDRLVEQCQGLPWLLKKLLVHIIKKIKNNESQYGLLERELDLDDLFKEDLSILRSNEIDCLKYIAKNAPIITSEAEHSFSNDTINSLLQQKLILRSGMNYVIYWDIFRDYLNEGKVPYIPWAKIFQREPKTCMSLLEKLSDFQELSTSELASKLNTKIGPLLNTLSDLIALQLVEQKAPEIYSVADYTRPFDLQKAARLVQNQMKRHIIYKHIVNEWDKNLSYSYDDFYDLFVKALPKTTNFSEKTIRTYSIRFARWLSFAGLITSTNNSLKISIAQDTQLGTYIRLKRGIRSSADIIFRAAASPQDLIDLLNNILSNKYASTFLTKKYRNAIEDARALNLVYKGEKRELLLTDKVKNNLENLDEYLKEEVLNTEMMKIFKNIFSSEEKKSEKNLTDQNLGYLLQKELDANWKESSSRRIAGGLKRYYLWAINESRYLNISKRVTIQNMTDFIKQKVEFTKLDIEKEFNLKPSNSNWWIGYLKNKNLITITNKKVKENNLKTYNIYKFNSEN